MNLHTRLAALPLTLVALTVPGFSQIQPSQALFSNTASAISVEGISSADPLLIRSPGTNGGVPLAWSASVFMPVTQFHPDFSMTALTGHWAPANITVPIFGGISTGGEIMPEVDADGAFHMTQSNWFMLAITVDGLTKGKPGSFLRQRTANGTISAAGDILSYYAIGSTGINSALPDTVRLESSMLQLKTQQVTPVTNGMRAITNLDIGAGINAEDELNQAGNQFPSRDCFYFTLTKPWVAAALSINSAYQLGNQPPSSSTVYGMTWNVTATPPWSAPFIVFSHSTLFPSSLFPNAKPGTVEIDALSVDRGSPPTMSAPTAPKRLIFSLTRDSNTYATAPALTFNQLLVYQSTPLTVTTRALMTDPLFPVTAPLSVTFTSEFGVREEADSEGLPDDIRSTCGGDPKEAHNIGRVLALATDQNRAGDGDLGLSALRTTPITTGDEENPNPPTDTLNIQVTGMDFSPYVLGFIQFYIEDVAYPPGTGSPAPPQPWGGEFWIDTAAIQRNAIDVHVPFPYALGTDPFRFSATCKGVVFTPTGPIAIPVHNSWVLSIKK